MNCDLHNHSIFSDGTDTPEELIRLAEEAGLEAVALTDHNSVDGLPRFLAAAEHSPVQAVPGIEFSTGWLDGELHILALFVREQDYEKVRTIAAEPDRLKRESNIALAAALNQAGYRIDYAAMEASTPTGRVNRSQFGDALLAAGYVKTKQEAFETLLNEKGPYYKLPQRLPALDTIRFIRSIGAVAVLAHPFFKHTEAQIRDFLDQAVPAGLDGMETIYATYDEETTRLAFRVAEEYHLLPSGGSDYHGKAKKDIAMGVGRGNLAIPAEYFRAFAALAAKRQG